MRVLMLSKFVARRADWSRRRNPPFELRRQCLTRISTTALIDGFPVRKCGDSAPNRRIALSRASQASSVHWTVINLIASAHVQPRRLSDLAVARYSSSISRCLGCNNW